MADDAKLRTAAGLSALWDGAAIKRVRADGTTILPDRRLSMHLMAQPGVAAGWVGDATLTDQGLLSRVLISAPDSTAGTRFWKDWVGNGALAEYDRRLFDLMRQPLPADQDAISSMISSLSPITTDRLIEDKPSDLAPYGLATPANRA